MQARRTRRAVLASPMWRSQAEAEGLTLLEADSTTGYYGVCLNNPGRSSPTMRG